MHARPAELIVKKRDGGELSAAEIADLIDGVVDRSFGDAQLGAWLMAVVCRGMTVAETSALTLAMRDSGRVLRLDGIPGRKIDKHSTGGVGDKVSLLLAPWVAAAGVPVPMVSGRGLGHTGGTIDKLKAIPGYHTDLTLSEFEAVLADCGFVMSAATADIAPADQRMYATRDVTGTVESIPLITASILSKKLAEGIDGLVMDIKCGRAAFMRERARAEQLMTSIVETGSAAGVDVVALLTDMDSPLGRACGNSLEVIEIVDCLNGRGPADLMEVTAALAAEMLVLGGVAPDTAVASERLRELLASGAVRDRFVANIERQGGDPAFVDDPALLGQAPVQLPWLAPRAGCVVDIDPLTVGLTVVDLGGGRAQADDDIDLTVGIVFERALGDPVAAGDTVATVHAADDAAAQHALQRLGTAVVIADDAPVPASRLLARQARSSCG